MTNPDNKQQTATQATQENRLNDIRLAPGEYIFKEGDQGEYGYTIVSGTIEVGKDSGGKFVTLTELGQGALFGEMILIDKAPRSASARAKGEAVVREIDKQAFMAYIMKAPETAINMMQRLSSYVRNSNQALEVSVFDIPKEDDTQEQPKHQEGTQKSSQSEEEKKQTLMQFQSPFGEIEHLKMPSVIRNTFYLIAAMFFIAVIFASFSVIDTTVSTSGRLTTTTPKIEVQASDSSVVKAIYVEAGQKVNKGDVLVELDPTLINAEYRQLKNHLQNNQALIDRLQSEKMQLGHAGLASIQDPLQKDIYQNRLKEYEAKINSFDSSIQKSQHAHEQAKMNYSIAKLDLEASRHDFSKTKRLVDEAILHQIALKEANYKIEKSKAQLHNSQTHFKSSKIDLEKLNKEKLAYINNWRSNINTQLSGAIQKQATQKEDLVKLERRKENSTIIAPESGIILKVDNLFVGSIVNSGKNILTLVPTDVPLNIEMDIKPNEISNILVGNEVSIKLNALPYQKHGEIIAKIDYISEDTVDTSIDGSKGTFYRATASIVDNQLKKLPDNFRLVPGMQLKGDIRSGKRVLITYFLYPVLRTIETSFREP